ncbi:hypothetical protein O3Q51_07045 [Cryomorphaceae bacterium 1068]|nr:hypothetical protein [Cryomorphaceae bacterium 1068]
MKKVLLSVLRFLGKTNLFISIASLFSILGALGFAGIPPDYSLAFFAFFAALFTYNFQRRVGDLNQDHSYSKTGTAMMVLGALGMGYYVFELAVHQIIVLAITGMISLAYAFPLFPSSKGKISLRLVPGLKLWTIVLVWTLSSVILPVMYAELRLSFIALFVVQQACFVAALTIPFDIRDLPVDWPWQKTIPQVLGVNQARNLALIFLLISAMAGFILFQLGDIDLNLFLVHLGVLLLSGTLISKAKTKNDELYFSIAIDGMLILQGAAFVLAKQYI